MAAGGVGVELDVVGEGDADGWVGEASGDGLDVTCALGLEPQPAITIERRAADETATTARKSVADGRPVRPV